VEYYDECTRTADAIGGLFYVHDPLKAVYVFDFDKAGVTDLSTLPPAWPTSCKSSSVSWKPEEMLKVVYPKWKSGTILFKPVTVVATC
jgi:hypothetical protein